MLGLASSADWPNTSHFESCKVGYTLITKYAKIGPKTEKCLAGYFVSLFSRFAFRISRQGRHSCKKSKDFVVYFFAALIKHEICMKREKCIASVSYFIVFRKNTQERIGLIATASDLPYEDGCCRETEFFWTTFHIFSL